MKIFGVQQLRCALLRSTYEAIAEHSAIHRTTETGINGDIVPSEEEMHFIAGIDMQLRQLKSSFEMRSNVPEFEKKHLFFHANNFRPAGGFATVLNSCTLALSSVKLMKQQSIQILNLR